MGTGAQTSTGEHRASPSAPPHGPGGMRDAAVPSTPGCRRGWGTRVGSSILRQEGLLVRVPPLPTPACPTARGMSPGLGKLRHTPARPASALGMSLSHLLKPSPAPTPTAGRPAAGMLRQGNKRERYQAPAELTARAEAGRRAGGRERRRKKKKKKKTTLNPEITYHSGCITHLESADTKM